MLTYAQEGVMITRPARRPFMLMPRSGFPITSHAVAVAVRRAAAAAMLVVTRISARSSGCATERGSWD